MIDASTHIGRGAVVEGSIIGRSCDIRAHARLQEGVALGDEVKVGEESVLMPGVRIYPYKEVESGAQIYENLIWESRVSSRLFERDSVSGLVNVDLTPEVVTKLAVALGTALPTGRADRGQPRGACRVPDDRARDDRRAQLDGRRRLGPARRCRARSGGTC